MNRMILVLISALLWMPGDSRADHKDLTLLVSPELIDSGLIRFLVPRFSLKTGVTLHTGPLIDATADADIFLRSGGAGRLVLRGQGQDFGVVSTSDNKKATRFVDWLVSEVGQRTIGQFRRDDVQIFTGVAHLAVANIVVILPGNAQNGEILAYKNCGRCHVISHRNRMKGIDSTPSFGVLRSFDDWQDRFESFYTLNPHPSFSQIIGVTAPFDPGLPPPISPLVLTPGQLDDIVAFASSVPPADLGAPLVHQ